MLKAYSENSRDDWRGGEVERGSEKTSGGARIWFLVHFLNVLSMLNRKAICNRSVARAFED